MSNDFKDIFKKYAEGLVEKKEDVVVPEVTNTFASEVVEEEVVEVPKKEVSPKQNASVQNEIDALLRKMLPQFGQKEDEILEKHVEESNKREQFVDPNEAQYEKLATTLLNPLHKKATPKPSNNPILDTLKKKASDPKIPQTTGLQGVEYEYYDPKKITFMPSLPRHELKHKDHSSIIVAKKCLREYFYNCVVNLTPAEDSNIFYPWGTAYHIYRQRLNEHYGFDTNEPKTLDIEHAKASHKKASKEGVEYWMENGEEQKPGSRYEWFTTERLFRSFQKGFEHWLAEKRKGQIKIIAVEQFFVIQLMDGNFVQGRIDEAILYNGDLWGRDFKTTSKPEEWFAKGLRPNNQVKTYTFGNGKLAGRKAKGIIIQAMYNGKTTKAGDKGPDVYEKPIECSDYEIEQWEKEQVQWNNILELCREKDVWPQSEVNCSWCNYQMVCTKQTEASMLYVLENKYKVKLRDPARIDMVVE